MNRKEILIITISLLVLIPSILLVFNTFITASQVTRLTSIGLISVSVNILYIKTEWFTSFISYNLAVNAESAIFGSNLTNMLLIILVIVLGVLSVFFMIIGLKRLKKEVEGVKHELETEKPVPMVYKFLLKTYSSIQNLNILNMVENRSIETEVRQIGVGYYTTTHYSSSSSGSGHSYTSTHPYTYEIRYNALIQLEKKNGKTLIKMNLRTGKLYLNCIITGVMFLIMAVIMGLVFSFIPFISNFWILPVLLLIFISLIMNIVFPRSVLKNYMRIAGDQFQLLVKKPIISLQIGTENEIQALQIVPVNKKDARYKKIARVCPFCGKIVSEAAQICESCGSELK